MGTPGRRESSPLEKLYLQSEAFDFFQGVRLVERDMLLKNKFSLSTVPSFASDLSSCFIGSDALPCNESIRFTVFPANSFPVSSVTDVKVLEKDRTGNSRKKTTFSEMQVSFMGLTGANGVLPQHYTELLLQRMYLNDYTLKDFFDLFNHRIISLFYKAWEKNKFYIGYEKAKAESRKKEDRFSSILSSLWGAGLPSLKERLEVSDEALSYYTGTLSRQINSSKALEGMLGDYLNLPVIVEQFQTKREKLQKNECSFLGGGKSTGENYNQLGVNFILGDCVCDINSKFRVKIGPLDYGKFKSLLPKESKLKALCQIIRLYVGLEFEFDIQLILAKEKVPKCQLGVNKESQANQLGLTTWLKTREFSNNSNDVVLSEKTG